MQDTTKQKPGFEVGNSLDGYTIERQIGEGGMARLYLARDADRRQRVLKVPHRNCAADPVAVVAFENELRLARYLEDFPHAYMPVSKRCGERDFLVMDYIEGTDLWSHLRQHGCLDETQALALAKKIVRALAELHRRRIVHLDVKLSNIMVTPAGEVRLVDFGLANHLDLPDHIYESFQEPKGTPAYIAPEQFFGVRDEPRSDIFSIGTLLYEMTTSRLPFADAHSELDVIGRIRSEPVSPRHYRPELSTAFEALVLTCLEKIPDRRFPSMDALLDALEGIEPAAAAPRPPQPPAGDTSAAPATAGLLARLTGRLWHAVRPAAADAVEEIKAWIAARQEQRQPRFRIVVALDHDGGTRAEVLNRSLLAAAMRQSALQPTSITLVTVLRDYNAAMADERERQELNAASQAARERMTNLIAEAGSGEVTVGINVRSGDPIAAIAACVADYEADLLIIGARERNALSRFVLGSTAYKVLTTIKCPVFVVQETVAKARRPGLTATAASGDVRPAATRAPASICS